MQHLNAYGIVRLELADDLRGYARKNIQNIFPSAPETKEPDFVVKISRLKENSSSRPQNCMEVDSAYKIAENFLEVKCKYKFSSWKYQLKWLSENTLDLRVSGDFYSSWCWPYRTLMPLLRLLMQRKGGYFFHSAGFLKTDSSAAVMLMAPSGTGKTLTSLHYLCENGKMFHDDTVLWLDGKLYPMMKSLNFWAYRYKNSPEVLPANLPVFDSGDRKRAMLFQCFRKMTLGYIGLSLSLDVKKYWQNCDAPVSPLKKIVILSKGKELREIPEIDRESIQNRLLGDLEFQNIPLIRIMEVETLTGFKILDAETFFAGYRNTLHKILEESELLQLEVPGKYSKDVFKMINGMIQK